MPLTLSAPPSPTGSSGAFESPERTENSTTDGATTDSHINSPIYGHVNPFSPVNDDRSLSRQAHRGSEPPSFLKDIKDIKKNSGYFGLGVTAAHSPLDKLAEDEEGQTSIIDASSPVSPPRTATMDSVHNKADSVQDRRVVVVDISALEPAVHAQSSEAPMGFAVAIKDMKRAGHPVHVLTTLAVAEEALVREWLRVMDISVGFGSEDDVAALWHVPAGDDNAKIGVIRAINAAFFCAAARHSDVGLNKLAKEGGLDWCFAVQVDSDQDTAMVTSEGHFIPLHGPTSAARRVPICSVQGWINVGPRLTECKRDLCGSDKQKRT